MSIVEQERCKVVLRFWACLAIFFLFSTMGCARNQPERHELTPEKSKTVPEIPYRIGSNEWYQFGIRWLGFEFGTADIRMEGIENIKGRDAYHLSMYVRSSPFIDLVYKVRDEHHSYIDVEHFHSLRYEKKLHEGRYRADEVMEYDQDNHTAVYHSRKNDTKKQMFIPEHVQDQLSAAFWLRDQAMTPGESVFIPVNADEQNWSVEIRVIRSARKEISGLGAFDALEIEPLARFQGVFIRRGRFSGWMSMDDNRLPLLMQSKIPVLGSVNIVLVNYEGRVARKQTS